MHKKSLPILAITNYLLFFPLNLTATKKNKTVDRAFIPSTCEAGAGLPWSWIPLCSIEFQATQATL